MSLASKPSTKAKENQGNFKRVNCRPFASQLDDWQAEGVRLSPPAIRAFTLIELLAALAIIAILAALLLPSIGKISVNAEIARDTGKMRSYAGALNSLIAERQYVSAEDVLRSGSLAIDAYAGGAEAAARMLNSTLWTKKTKEIAAAAGRTVNHRTRSYTLNDSLFPPKAQQPGQPAPAPWEIDSVSPIKLREKSDRPLLFTGVYLSGHDGAYVWGGRSHSNPIYDETRKDRATTSILGRTLVLFVGGHVRLVDFSKENQPASDGTADPEGWWKRTF